MGVVIEMCIKYPGGPTRIKGTDISLDGTRITIYIRGMELNGRYTWPL